MIDYSIYTDIGSREINEDAVNAVEHGGRFGFIVCDGLGGHGMGDAASQTVAGCFEEYFKAYEGAPQAFLPGMFDYAQASVIKKKNRLNIKNQMCTTAASLLICDGKAYTGYIGDSRIYVFEDNDLKYKSLDHSLTQMLVLRGEIAEEDIPDHPDRNKLLRAIGTDWDKPMYSLEKPIQVKENQAFLLCSDGFWEWISTYEMLGTLKKSANAEEWLSAMVKIIEEKTAGKTTDNNSAVAVINYIGDRK